MAEKRKNQERISYAKQIFDLKQMLEISKSLNSSLEYDKLIETILYICMGQMQVLDVALFTKKDIESSSFTLDHNYRGFDVNVRKIYELKDDHPVLDKFTGEIACITWDSLKKDLPDLSGLESIEEMAPKVLIPLKVKNSLKGLLLLGERICSGDTYSAYEQEQIVTIAKLISIAINNAGLMEMSTTDSMTKLKLKHYFYSMLSDFFADPKMPDTPLSIIMFDIDHFKNFNDSYGHDCGDHVLQQVAGIIQSCVRPEDLAARYGGEEFVIMLRNTELNTAASIAERVRDSVEQLNPVYDGKELHITISAGCAQYDSVRDIREKAVVIRADEALYISKQNGRNRVSCAG